MKVFLIGPMRFKPHLNFDVFDEVHDWLEERGDLVLNPAERIRIHAPGLMKQPWFKDGAVEAEPVLALWIGESIRSCDQVILLPGWSDSVEAIRQYNLAFACGKQTISAHKDGLVWRFQDDDGGYCKEPEPAAPMSSITTWSGRRVDVLNPNPNDITVADVAHALARQCRYNGHLGGFLSVARHSIWVSQYCESYGPVTALWGLFHDAAEAYIGDMVSPFKRSPQMQMFREVETQMEMVIAEVLGLPHPMPDEVHDADKFVTHEVEMRLGLKDSWRSTCDEDEVAFLERWTQLEYALDDKVGW